MHVVASLQTQVPSVAELKKDLDSIDKAETKVCAPRRCCSPPCLSVCCSPSCLPPCCSVILLFFSLFSRSLFFLCFFCLCACSPHSLSSREREHAHTHTYYVHILESASARTHTITHTHTHFLSHTHTLRACPRQCKRTQRRQALERPRPCTLTPTLTVLVSSLCRTRCG